MNPFLKPQNGPSNEEKSKTGSLLVIFHVVFIGLKITQPYKALSNT